MHQLSQISLNILILKKQGKLVSHAKTKLFDKPRGKIKSKQKLHSIFIMSKTH